MADVVPELNRAIKTDFQGYVMKDKQIATVSKRIRDGTATFADGHLYSERLGENLSRALVNNLNENTLPDGKLYYNIAKRTVTPNLMNNYDLTNETAAEIQRQIDLANGIGLKAAKAEFPESRIQGLIDKMTADNITLDRAIQWLIEPIVNNSEAFFDDFIKENAKVRNDLGLKTTITRTYQFGCCDWCANLAGVYEYDSVPQDVYRRHEFCRCTVTYQSKKQSQNVWSKKTWSTSQEELDRRKDAGGVPVMSAIERLNQLDQIERDNEIANFIKQTGYDRETARRSTLGKDPDEIEKEIKKIIERQKAIKRR